VKSFQISGLHYSTIITKKLTSIFVIIYLESSDGCALEPEIGLEVLSDLTDESLERQLTDQQLRRLLVATDFTESHGAGTIAMGLLHSSC
jgi:hypothetical protein